MALTPPRIASIFTHSFPEKAASQTGNHYPFRVLGRLFIVITSTPHSQATTVQRYTNTALQHRQEDLYDEPGRLPPASQNPNPTGKHAAADSLPRNLAGAEP